MPLFCYVHSRGATVPYLEVLAGESTPQALRRAAELMADRPDAVRAELWDGETLLHTLERETAA